MISLWLAWIFCCMTAVGGYLYGRDRNRGTETPGTANEEHGAEPGSPEAK